MCRECSSEERQGEWGGGVGVLTGGNVRSVRSLDPSECVCVCVDEAEMLIFCNRYVQNLCKIAQCLSLLINDSKLHSLTHTHTHAQ